MQLLDNWNKEILRLAIPSIISNVTVPLLGLVDLAVVGHIGNEAYISAIAVGSMIFNVMYWLLGFLRMGTSGMTSQAYGRQDGQECMNILVRTLTIGVGMGVLFIVAQRGIEWGMLRLMNTPEASWHFVATYFRIVIWGAPAMLGLYGLTGWFIGMQDKRPQEDIFVYTEELTPFSSHDKYMTEGCLQGYTMFFPQSQSSLFS